MTHENNLDGITWTESPRLLHAALWNSDIIPPIVIELILQLYPLSVYKIQLDTSLYPLHAAATIFSYIPLPFERNLFMGTVLEMITLFDGCLFILDKMNCVYNFLRAKQSVIGRR